MLCQFIFKNFKSYRDETVFDLQATSIREYSERLLVSEGDAKEFLPISAVYGPNAGGKSGILEALNTLISHVMDPIKYIKHMSPSTISMKHMRCPAFAFNEWSRQEPTEFTIFFRHGAYEFGYTLALLNGRIVFESLYRKKIGRGGAAKVFERDLDKVTLGSALTSNKKSVNVEVNPQMPYLSFLSLTYNFDIINVAIEWFSECLFINYANLSGSLLRVLATEEDVEKTRVINMMQEMDIPISDYIIEYKDEAKEEINKIYLVRMLAGKEYKLNLLEESGGTRKLFGLLPLILITLSVGGLLAVDELDAYLHPKLLRYVIKLFTDKSINKENAQLVFSSHDISTMKNDLFRRDEIWFASKNDEGASTIYSLYDIRKPNGEHVKSTEPFDKQYLEGRYGADPYLSEMLSPTWEDSI